MIHRSLTLAIAACALAASDSAATQTLSDCVAVNNDTDRLACYDRVTNTSPAANGQDPLPATPAEPSASTMASPPPLQTPPPAAAYSADATDFGFETRKTTSGAQQIESRYDGNFTGWSGKTLFRLENGQVWKQAQNGRISYRAARPVMTIKRAAFGSFRLHVEGLNRSIRVTRVK